jgi:hypothetical protein
MDAEFVAGKPLHLMCRIFCGDVLAAMFLRRCSCGDVLAAMFLTIFRGIEDREDGPGFDKICGRLDFLKSASKNL